MLLIIDHILIFSSPWPKHMQKNSETISWSLSCKHWFENIHHLKKKKNNPARSACWGMVSYCLISITMQYHGKCTLIQFILAFIELLNNLHLSQYSKQTRSFQAMIFEVTLICNLILMFIHRHDIDLFGGQQELKNC